MRKVRNVVVRETLNEAPDPLSLTKKVEMVQVIFVVEITYKMMDTISSIILPQISPIIIHLSLKENLSAICTHFLLLNNSSNQSLTLTNSGTNLIPQFRTITLPSLVYLRNATAKTCNPALEALTSHTTLPYWGVLPCPVIVYQILIPRHRVHTMLLNRGMDTEIMMILNGMGIV